MFPPKQEIFGITYLPHFAPLLWCPSEAVGAKSWKGPGRNITRCGSTRIFQAPVVSMCDLRCYFILHLYNINPTEYLVKQLQAVSFKETSDNPKMPVSPGT